MFHIVLFEPEIPPNTGNIIRLAANSGCQLHLIEPMGFRLEEKKLRRAGLDYREFAEVICYRDYQDFLNRAQPKRLFACTTKTTQPHSGPSYQADDFFLLGPETRGLPEEILQQFLPEQKIRIPMQANSRSLNLSNATAVIIYEAWRQCDFMGAN